MPEDQRFTRCPSCKTIFRVTGAQLAVRAGQVRCGHCSTVFDGNAQRISLAPPAPGAGSRDDAYDEAALGPPTITLRNAHALHSVEPPAGVTPLAAHASPIATSTATTASAVPPVKPSLTPDIAYEERFSWARKKTRRLSTVLYGIGVPLLLLLLLGQAAYHFRDLVAARWPVMRPLLESTCELSGCWIRPLRDSDAFPTIVASNLQADPAHRGLLILTATVRNHATWTVPFPNLDLTLTDLEGKPVVRRVLRPAEYVPGTLAADKGFAANGEIELRLFVDASATTQAGYNLELFYP